MTSTVGEIGLRFARPGLSGLSGGLIWGAATAIAHPGIAKPGEPGLTLGNWGSWRASRRSDWRSPS